MQNYEMASTTYKGTPIYSLSKHFEFILQKKRIKYIIKKSFHYPISARVEQTIA